MVDTALCIHLHEVYRGLMVGIGVCVHMQWVNGAEVVSHSGGHLPFQANITDLVKPGAPNTITVAINNTLTPHTLPPGTLTHGGPPELPEGFVSLNYQFDFYNYAGGCTCVYSIGIYSGTTYVSPGIIIQIATDIVKYLLVQTFSDGPLEFVLTTTCRLISETSQFLEEICSDIYGQ